MSGAAGPPAHGQPGTPARILHGVETTSAPAITPAPRGLSPFDTSGISRDKAGVAHYDRLAPSLTAMIRASVEAHPGNEAVVEVGGGRLTFRQLWARAARVAGGLRDLGVTPGDRVALRCPAGIDWVLAFAGSQLAGAITVPVNTRFAEREVEYVIEDSGSSFVFMPGAALPDGEPLVAEGATLGDVAAIFYTSGTTGFPKGAMTSHENFLANVETCLRVTGIDRERGSSMRTLVSVPLFHVTGCNAQLLLMLAIGGTTVVLPTFNVDAFLDRIIDERIDLLTSVPAIYALALMQPRFRDLDVSGISRVSYGGAPISPALVHGLKQAFPAARVGNGFGLTESSSVLTFLPHEEAADHADSVGFPAPVCDLAILEPRDDGVGELLARGPNIVAGYWNKPEQTAGTFEGGWLHTGDMARIDERGLVYIVDRAKDMINRGGENVYCVEVENALAGAPGIAEAAVIGIPDSILGERVGAVVVPRPGQEFSADTVRAWLADRLADFKQPEHYAVRSEPLPRNPGGKVLKPVLRKETVWPSPPR